MARFITFPFIQAPLTNDNQPHITETANRLDPHVGGGSTRLEDATNHYHQEPSKTGGGAEQADSAHKDIGLTSADATRIGDTNLPDTHGRAGHNSGAFNTGRDAASGNSTGTSHTGRNAALGGVGAAGAAGLAKQ